MSGTPLNTLATQLTIIKIVFDVKTSAKAITMPSTVARPKLKKANIKVFESAESIIGTYCTKFCHITSKTLLSHQGISGVLLATQ
jgi:hypothetical protein